MKLTQALMAATAAVGLASVAQADNGFDGTAFLNYIHAPDDNFDYVINGGGSAVFDLGGDFRVQADLVGFFYEGDDDLDTTANVHFVTTTNSGMDLGLGLSAASYGSGAFDEIGAFVELRQESENFAVEAFFFQYLGDDSEYADLGIEGEVFVSDTLGLYGGIALEYDASVIDMDNIYAGARVGLGNGMELDARASLISEYRYFSLSFVKHFGDGRVFAPRGYRSAFPGY